MFCSDIDLVNGSPDREGRTFALTFGQSETQSSWADRRNLTWGEFCEQATGHQEGDKRGPCISPTVFRRGRRKKADADQIDLAILDIDCGHGMDEIAKTLKRSGYAAVIYSTHSHRTTRTRASRGAWEAFCEQHCDGAVELFLQRKGYLSRIAKGAKVIETSDKEVIFEHNPIPKFRVVIPLSRSWRAKDYPDQQTANAAWPDRIKALALKLGLTVDMACTDTSRLFYLPRHASGALYETEVIEGNECDIWSLPSNSNLPPPNKKEKRTVDSKKQFLATDPGTGEAINLKPWAAEYGHRFQIANAIKIRSPEILTECVIDGMKYHIRCPNDDQHTNPDPDTATFVLNAGQSDNIGFTIHCLHAHCVDLDRLLFLQRVIEHGWISVADLTDPQFLLPGADNPPSYDECMVKIEKLNEDSQPQEINEALDSIYRANLDSISHETALKRIKKQTKATLGSMKNALKSFESASMGPAEDIGLKVAKLTLDEFYASGSYLVRNIDKCFWHYNGTHWSRLNDEQVRNRILDVIERHISPETLNYQTALDAAIKLLIAKCAVQDDVLRLAEEPLPVINCQNGELWIADNGVVELRPHHFGSYLTYVLDVDYDPTATCPRFDRALLEIFANSSDSEDMARHFMEFIGYTIQPIRDIACYFILRGFGRNGKTKLMETVVRLLNKKAIYADRIGNIEKNRFVIGSLAGKLLLLDDDVDANTILPDGLLKKLSERKTMTGEQKFKDAFEFVAICLPVMLANNLPSCNDLSFGQRRRAKIIPFDRIFTDKDKDDKLFPAIWADEMPGILNRAIEGLKRLRTRGDFLEPIDCHEAQNKWLSQANPLASFLDECTKDNLEARIPMKIFYAAFTKWATEAGIRSIPQKNTVKGLLEGLGYTIGHNNAGSVIFGLEFECYLG